MNTSGNLGSLFPNANPTGAGNTNPVTAPGPQVSDNEFRVWLYQSANTSSVGVVNAAYRTNKLAYIRNDHKSKLNQHIVEHLILQDIEPISVPVQIEWKQGLAQATKHAEFLRFVANTHPKDPYTGM